MKIIIQFLDYIHHSFTVLHERFITSFSNPLLQIEDHSPCDIENPIFFTFHPKFEKCNKLK
jgi:hypothetical protein